MGKMTLFSLGDQAVHGGNNQRIGNDPDCNQKIGQGFFQTPEGYHMRGSKQGEGNADKQRRLILTSGVTQTAQDQYYDAEDEIGQVDWV